MPLAGDAYLAGTLPAPNNPLNRISYQPFKAEFDVEAFIAQWTQFVETYLFPIIEDLTGLDLSILQPVLDGITAFVGFLQDALHGVVSGDWTQLVTVFGNLFGFLNFDLNDSAFNPISAAIQFFVNILHPSGLVVGATDVIGAIVGDTLVVPFTVGGDTGPVPQWFIDIPQAIEDLITNLVNAFAKLDPTGITGRFADLMQQAFDMFNGLFNQGRRLDASVTSLEAAVFGAADEDAIQIPFSGAAADLDTLNWVTYEYGASGMVMRQQDDYAYMGGSAGADSTQIMVLDDPTKVFTSNIQSCTHLFREKQASSGQCGYWAPLRVNKPVGASGLNGCGVFRSRGGSGGRLAFVIQIAGVATELAAIPGADDDQVAVTGLSFAANDRLDVTVGDPDPDLDPVADYDQKFWRWRAWHNTELVMDYVFNPEAWNPAAADLLDETTHNHPAFGMTQDFIFVFFPDNVVPTTVEALLFTVPKN